MEKQFLNDPRIELLECKKRFLNIATLYLDHQSPQHWNFLKRTVDEYNRFKKLVPFWKRMDKCPETLKEGLKNVYVQMINCSESQFSELSSQFNEMEYDFT